MTIGQESGTCQEPLMLKSDSVRTIAGFIGSRLLEKSFTKSKCIAATHLLLAGATPGHGQ